MQQTDVNLDILDSLDFEPCCEGESERDCKSLGTPARWLVIEPCGCDWLACDFHLKRRIWLTEREGWSWCPECGDVDHDKPGTIPLGR